MHDDMPHNGPFPSYAMPLFQNESSHKAFRMKMSLICMKMNLHFHMNGFAGRLVLTQTNGNLETVCCCIHARQIFK